MIKIEEWNTGYTDFAGWGLVQLDLITARARSLIIVARV